MDVELTMSDELASEPEKRVTAVAVRVSPELRESTGVDVLV